MENRSENIRVLYVEDDDTIAYITRDNLEIQGYHVEHVKDGVSALEKFKQNCFDICVVDIMLPKMNGYTLASEIRKLDDSIPVLFLSAKSLVEDRIKGLKTGADDYITKPFSIKELILRMEVFLKRRKGNQPIKRQAIHIGSLYFDQENQVIKQNNKTIVLTQRECELLSYFITNRDRIMKRAEILNSLWGDDDYFMGRSLDVFVSRLRKKLKIEPSVVIENIHGVGYRLKTQ